MQAFRCSADGLSPSIADGRFYRFKDFPTEAELRKQMADAREIVTASDDVPHMPKKTILPDGSTVSTQVFLGGGAPESKPPGGAKPQRKQGRPPGSTKKADKPEIEKAGETEEAEQLPMMKTTGFDDEVWGVPRERRRLFERRGGRYGRRRCHPWKSRSASQF